MGAVTDGGYDTATLEELAARAEHRAARARRHARIARERADTETACGRRGNARLYRREAEAHEQAAIVSEQRVELYRRDASRLASGIPLGR